MECLIYPSKMRYEEKEEAVRALLALKKRKGRKRHKTYECHIADGGCGGFHIGHWRQKPYKRKGRRIRTRWRE